jgi:hypothetical protein
LEALGLTDAESFLALPGPVVSGHPERHVRRVRVGPVTAYLKCEHRVPPRDRLRHWLAGYGWVSKCLRERRALADLEAAGLPAPRWLAAGEDGRGRAFLLVEEVPGAVDLRRSFAELGDRPAGERRHFAQALGWMLARLHAAGFDQPDLSAKHILVTPGRPGFTVIDWQNAGRRERVAWRQRIRALAMLDATVRDDLASPRDRLRVLRAYLHNTFAGESPVFPRRSSSAQVRRGTTLAAMIHRESLRLRNRRTVREARLAPLADGSQHLYWLDGEALCAVPSVADELAAPRWRAAVYADPGSEIVTLSDGRSALLTRRCHRERRADELRQAGLLFHLQRHGIPAARLLAFGQHGPRAFLMTEAPESAISLAELAATGRMTAGAVRSAVGLLRRLHAGRYHGDADFATALGQAILVRGADALVGRVDHLRLSRRPLTTRQTRHDRQALLRFIRSARRGRP